MLKLIKNKIAKILTFLFYNSPKDIKSIPIFINNYNRLTTLKKLIESLEKRGYKNIHILDNQSQYKPLLNYYESIPYKVHFFRKNYGFKSFWKSGLWLKYMTSNYVYTDSDLELVDECPDDFLAFFYALLQKYPKVHKVGFSLKIDDLPNYYELKNEVIEWESKFYDKEIEKNIFIAPIDTTFALYRPFSKRGSVDGTTLMFRTGFPYQARHLPWYLNSKNLSEEELFYVNSLQCETHWSKQNIN